MKLTLKSFVFRKHMPTMSVFTKFLDDYSGLDCANNMACVDTTRTDTPASCVGRSCAVELLAAGAPCPIGVCKFFFIFQEYRNFFVTIDVHI